MAEQSGQQQDGGGRQQDAAQAQQADRGKHLRHFDANVDETINRKCTKRWEWQEAKVTEAAKLEEMGATQKVKYGRERLQEELAELAREGFGKYRVEPVGDERSREVCSALVGKAFPIDGARVGATLPPIHPRCRCQIAPAVDDWDAWIRDQVDRRQAKIAAGRVGGVGARKASDGSTPSHNVILRGKQFGKKARKHAGEWGLDVSSEEDRRTFCDITAEIIDGADDVVHGEWRGQGTECTFYIKGNDVVIVNGYDEYVTTMRGGASNAQVKHAGDKDAKRRGRQEVHEVL